MRGPPRSCGSVYYNARHQTGKEHGTARVVGWSTDQGLTFGTHQDPRSPPDTAADAVPGPLLEMDGQMVLALPLGPARSNIAVHKSPDGGVTWTRSRRVSGGYGGYSGLAALPPAAGAPTWTRARLSLHLISLSSYRYYYTTIVLN